jgi:hypothetical protein
MYSGEKRMKIYLENSKVFSAVAVEAEMKIEFGKVKLDLNEILCVWNRREFIL